MLNKKEFTGSGTGFASTPHPAAVEHAEENLRQASGCERVLSKLNVVRDRSMCIAQQIDVKLSPICVFGPNTPGPERVAHSVENMSEIFQMMFEQIAEIEINLDRVSQIVSSVDL